MRSRIDRSLVLPLCDPDRYRGIANRLAALEQFDSLSPQEQAAIQEQRVRLLLDHAYKTSPYYRLVFDEMQFRSVDWRYGQPIPLPELNRELLRANMENLCSRSFRPDSLRRFMSGGSPPAAMWRDLQAYRDAAAMECHLNRLCGVAGARVLEIRPTDRPADGTRSRLAQKLVDAVLGRLTIAIRHADDETFRDLLSVLNRQKPAVICGPSSLLAMFAEWLRHCGVGWHRPRRVIGTGETPPPERRQAMVEIFGAPVTAQYLCPDVGILAMECQEGERLHFHPWVSYISLVPAGRSTEGSIYRLIVTDLLNYGMPLIRYDSGDCVLYDESPCPCGCWYPSVTTVLGPSIESLVLPNGTVAAGVPIVLQAGRSFRTVHGVQLIQKTPDSMLLRFSSDGDSSAADRELGIFRRNIEDAFQIPLHWTMERVREIPREGSGKVRVAICEIARDRQGPDAHAAL